MKFAKLSGIAILSVALLASCGNNCEHEHYLKVAGDPTTTYESGDHFSTDGLQVYLCCDKCGQEKELKKYDVNEHDDYLKTKTKFVTIEYGDLTYNIDVEVTFDYTFTGTITCVGDSLTEGHNWPNQSYQTTSTKTFQKVPTPRLSTAARTAPHLKLSANITLHITQPHNTQTHLKKNQTSSQSS